MRVPHEILIKGKRIKIVMVDTDEFYEDDHLGEAHYDEREVLIKRNLSPKEAIKTILHELLHFIDYYYDLKLKHQNIYDLEEPLYQLMSKNPEFIEMFIRKKRTPKKTASKNQQ